MNSKPTEKESSFEFLATTPLEDGGEIFKFWKSGQVDSKGLLSLFLKLIDEKYSGSVVCEFSGFKKKVFFDQGRFVNARSNQIDDRLGEVAYRMGMLSLDGLTDCAGLVTEEKKLGQLLVSKGIFSYSQLILALKAQMTIVLQTIFMSESIQFTLLDEDEYLLEIPFVEDSAMLMKEISCYAWICGDFIKGISDDCEINMNRNYYDEVFIDDLPKFHKHQFLSFQDEESEIYDSFPDRSARILDHSEGLQGRSRIENEDFTAVQMKDSTADDWGVFDRDFLRTIAEVRVFSLLKRKSRISETHLYLDLFRLYNRGVISFSLPVFRTSGSPQFSKIANMIDSYCQLVKSMHIEAERDSVELPKECIVDIISSIDSSLSPLISLDKDFYLSAATYGNLQAIASLCPERVELICARLQSLTATVLLIVNDTLSNESALNIRSSYKSIFK